MKRIFFSTLAAATLLASCTSQAPKNEYILEGTIRDANNQYIYMAYAMDDMTVKTDSALITNDAFRFEGTLEKPFRNATLYMGNANDYMNTMRCGIILEPVTMSISIEKENFSKPVIKGSFTQAQADSVQNALYAIQAEMAELEKAYQAETDKDKAYAIREQMTPYHERMKKIYLTFVQTHPDSYVAPEYMRGLMGEMKYEEIKAIYDNFTDKVKQYGDVKEIEEELAALERTMPGAPAPDFATLNVHGDSIRFSEVVKGKYVLLDFWASWCVPCRKSFPHVKALYDKYHDKGLEVFCVADNDNSEDQWHEAIKKDGVEKFHHVLRGMRIIDEKTFRFDKTNDISDKYAIHFLPTKYLIDKDFKIIGKFNDEELDAKLKELFGF